VWKPSISLGGSIAVRLRAEDEIIRDYEWLIDHYNSGDELFIFGFSRGAYTARSLGFDLEMRIAVGRRATVSQSALPGL
jgi:uncharacterized protein (DUF2235 family)